ncbi:hypothetical protein BAY1663_01225 [Pseudomonas sp. BAY1663]|jgi:hypothetical protein|nr:MULTISPECIES: hypothetical protein [Pseudomonadaceae]EXF46336.1 hypothetical protein BAY1663_01225 [Pseudomonas sp. BAY1663]
MRRLWLGGGAALLLGLLALLAWWGWQRGGLALLQLGLGSC